MTEMLASDIRFDTGENIVLVFDTDVYSGNIERHLAAYAVGAFDEDRYHGGDEYDEFMNAIEDQPQIADLLISIREKVTSQVHEEYGEISNTIWPTPGRKNDGRGRMTDIEPGDEKFYPAYESVAVFLSEPLTPEELEIVKARAIEYSEKHVDLIGCAKPFNVLAVRQLKITVDVVPSAVTIKVE